MKLSEAQRNGLKQVSISPGKSGAFFRDLGVHVRTLVSLERLGLVEGSGDFRPIRQQWRLTQTGAARAEEAARG